ncbi:MAG: ZIP family metal transporter [Acidilobaceae archaeon]
MDYVGDNSILLAMLMGTLAAIATTIGALPVLLVRYSKSNPYSLEKLLNAGLGFSSGVMIVASFTSLLLPSIEGGGLTISLIGFIGGALALAFINELIPHEHIFKGFEGPIGFKKIKTAWLVALAIILHNLPEGYSIGVASAYQTIDGLKVGLAISIQDVPEGLAVALPVLAITGSKPLALIIAFFSGLSELITAIAAVTIFGEYENILYLGLSSAAGAMIYVVSHEALPESHRTGREKEATIGFFIGFIIMLYLDTLLA